MKFTIERRALIKMLEAIGRKAPSKRFRDKEVRLSACDARVFVEANESIGGIESLVTEDGTCQLNYKIFLRVLKTYRKKKTIAVDVNDRRISFVTTSLPVSQFSAIAVAPGKFTTFPVTDDWLAHGRFEKQLMGKLPNVEIAIIQRKKIVDYLLNPEHAIGKGKANFFIQLGFSADKWEQFADALRTHAQKNDVVGVSDSGYGPRYEVEGRLVAPDGRTFLVRSIWQQDKGEIAPRLITAYPLAAR